MTGDPQRHGVVRYDDSQTAFRAGNRVGLDERVWALSLLRIMPLDLSNLYILPRLYALHLLDAAVRLAARSGLGVRARAAARR